MTHLRYIRKDNTEPHHYVIRKPLSLAVIPLAWNLSFLRNTGSSPDKKE